MMLLEDLKYTLLPYMLNEERGVYKKYEDIGDEVYNALCNIKPKMIYKDVYLFNLTNYTPKADSFFSSLSVMCFIGLDEESSFNTINDENHLSKDMKLKNCFIKLCVDKDRNFNLPDKNDFMLSFCHELHHAYRYHSIISNNHGDVTKGELRSMEILNTISNSDFYNKNRPEYSEFVVYLTNAVYLTNDNEINTYSSEVYEYLKQHSEINQYNFVDEVGNIPVYKMYMRLSNIIRVLDNEHKNMNFMDAVYDVTEKLLHFDVDKQNCVFRLRQYLAHKLEKFQSQFFKVAKKALYDLGRYGKTNEDFIRDIKISNQLREIFRRDGT